MGVSHKLNKSIAPHPMNISSHRLIFFIFNKDFDFWSSMIRYIKTLIDSITWSGRDAPLLNPVCSHYIVSQPFLLTCRDT